MKTIEKALLMTLPLFMLFSCSEKSEVEELNQQEETQNEPTVVEWKPIKLTQEQRVFANDNNQFTLNFLKTVNDADQSGKSFVYSPLSITYVLGMVNDAAVGTTQEELEQTLGFHQGGIEAVNQYCKTLIEGLPKVDENVQLNIANAIFVNKEYDLKESFQQDMQSYYEAKAEALDFSSPKTLDIINDWCKEKTKGMIPTILKEVNPEAFSYLLNAIYFKANWRFPFDEKDTKTETFTTEHGEVQLPLMHQNVIARYMKNDTYSAVEIPYGGGWWNMTVMLPEEGYTTDDIIDRLAKRGSLEGDPTMCSTMGDFVYQRHEVDLKLPRFETTSDTDEMEGKLIKQLKSMGINLAFDPLSSEIPNMCKNRNAFISMMRQKAVIKVNEKGAEAAAVTIAGMVTTEAGPMEYPQATFHANRPFVYVIREASSGVLLFVGKFTGM